METKKITLSKKEKENLINKIDELRRKKFDEIHKKLEEYYQLVDEFDYEKNGIEETKNFIKYILFDISWKLDKEKGEEFVANHRWLEEE